VMFSVVDFPGVSTASGKQIAVSSLACVRACVRA
jgi:hypothetical protein